MATKRKQRREPWNKGKIVYQKAPLKLREIYMLRIFLKCTTYSVAAEEFAVSEQ